MKKNINFPSLFLIVLHTTLRPVHTIRFDGSDFSPFSKSERLNTFEVPFGQSDQSIWNNLPLRFLFYRVFLFLSTFAKDLLATLSGFIFYGFIKAFAGSRSLTFCRHFAIINTHSSDSTCFQAHGQQKLGSARVHNKERSLTRYFGIINNFWRKIFLTNYQQIRINSECLTVLTHAL